jgi:replicative DNA helicase
VSVTDGTRAEPRSGSTPPAAPVQRDGQFDKTPPQDIAAEQCVIGGMLLSKDAIADVVEILKSTDFYRPVHATVFDAILDLYGRGEPADAITVAAALADSGDLGRVGGAPYLHTLIASVPTAANAAYYARIVGERAVLRRLVEAGTRIVQLGYGSAAGGGRDVDDVVDLAQQAVYDVTERRVSEDFAILADMLQPTLDEIEAVGAQGGMMTGVPTGFTDLDRLLNGLHPGQLIIVAGRPGLGKALALDTPLPTPAGWTTMGEVAVGDQLLGADGRPTTVTAAFEVRHDRPCHEVEFSDGTVIVADAEHLWKTTVPAGRRQGPEWLPVSHRPERSPRRVRGERWSTPLPPRGAGRPESSSRRVREEASAPTLEAPGRPAAPHGALGALDPGPAPQPDARRPGTAVDHRVLTTAQIAGSLRSGSAGRRPEHAVANCAPLALPERDLPVPPYTLGVWLAGGDLPGGDGSARVAVDDPEVVRHVEREGFEARSCGAGAYTLVRPQPARRPGRAGGGSLAGLLRGAGLIEDKHLPVGYLRASPPQRRALLAGLLDTAGTVTAGGNARYRTTFPRLAEGLRELAVGLGHGCTLAVEVVPAKAVEAFPARVVEADPDGAPRSPTTYTLSFSASDDLFRLVRKRLAHARRCRAGAAARTGSRVIVDVRPVPSVPVRCVTVDNADHLYLASRAMIPTHNSTASMDFARNAAIRANHASAIFSLEMSKVEIVMRLLSAEARVPLHVLRSGQLSDDDWTKLARCMGEISEAPLFVDDTPNMNLMEIRAKSRRLKQRHDLKMIVVDYLQLMSSPKRTESRQQEVAELSRGLKLLAKEIECPVIAVSQLNRGPEQRTDKRPQLSDLRESGCLTAGTRVIRADDNSEITLGELLAVGDRSIPVWALDEKLRYTPRTMTHAFPSGTREVFRLTLGSGKQIEATSNHPFLTFDGWIPLAELVAGARIATPRHIPAPLNTRPWARAEVVLLAHLLGGGSFGAREPIRYASCAEENLGAVTRAAGHFGVGAVRDDAAAAGVTTLRLPTPPRLARDRRNPIAEWLDGLGLFGPRSHERFVPGRVFSLPKEQVTQFLRHLWAADGSVTVGGSGRDGRVRLRSTSGRMLEDVSRLLLRYGISARLCTVPVPGRRPRYTLDIPGRDDQLRFLREIGVHGERAAGCARLLAAIEAADGNAKVDTVPSEVWGRVRELLTEPSTGRRGHAASRADRAPAASDPPSTPLRGATLLKRSPGRASLAEVAEVLDTADLDLHATNDVFWDEVRSVESLGEREVYDATVLGVHNFIANGIAVHNSIEQDADVVILLHRDDYYDKESPRAGEADFIVAKHRNGPTDTVTVAAQLHLSRFVDMAI